MTDDAHIQELGGSLRPSRRASTWLRWAAPLFIGAALLGAWEALVKLTDVPAYKLPAPSAIAATAAAEWAPLSAAWRVTLTTMLSALVLAVVVGVALAAGFASSRIVEATFFPYAVILQVTPLVAVAPFIVLWLNDRVGLAQVLCAWIVSFFPILSNTSVGLRSTDRGHVDLFNLYGATRWQKLRLLLAPSALPYFLAGLRISANLALVGAIVGEFVIGPATDRPGLATTILASQLRLDTPMMFAALAVVSLTGLAVYFLVQVLSYVLLRGWHESTLTEA
jgi:NitT/TauT family transport system permease protein